MRLNPDTLEEETEEERNDRQRRTGVIGNGLTVICFPNPEDPLVYEERNRVVCLTKPLSTCPYCRHSGFTLVFDANAPTNRYERIACPQWVSATARVSGKDPDHYVAVETATCESKSRFDFCPSCPSKEDLQRDYSADKTKEGWYSRFRRFRAEEFSG